MVILCMFVSVLSYNLSLHGHIMALCLKMFSISRSKNVCSFCWDFVMSIYQKCVRWFFFLTRWLLYGAVVVGAAAVAAADVVLVFFLFFKCTIFKAFVLWNTSQSFHIQTFSAAARWINKRVRKCNRYTQAHKQFGLFMPLNDRLQPNRTKLNWSRGTDRKIERSEDGERKKTKHHWRQTATKLNCVRWINSSAQIPKINRMFWMNLLIARATFIRTHQPLNDTNWNGLYALCTACCVFCVFCVGCCCCCRMLIKRTFLFEIKYIFFTRI